MFKVEDSYGEKENCKNQYAQNKVLKLPKAERSNYMQIRKRFPTQIKVIQAEINKQTFKRPNTVKAYELFLHLQKMDFQRID